MRLEFWAGSALLCRWLDLGWQCCGQPSRNTELHQRIPHVWERASSSWSKFSMQSDGWLPWSCPWMDRPLVCKLPFVASQLWDMCWCKQMHALQVWAASWLWMVSLLHTGMTAWLTTMQNCLVQWLEIPPTRVSGSYWQCGCHWRFSASFSIQILLAVRCC